MSELVSVWLRGEARCEDCDLRNALSPTGTSLFSKRYGYNRSYACLGCGGTGKQSTKVSVDAESALALLTDKQRFVKRLRLGLADHRRWKQQEIADLLGVTRQAVTKHEEKARERIRCYAAGMAFYLP
jgi:predicted DNA-binding protein YlxM (UPF0122 family)